MGGVWQKSVRVLITRWHKLNISPYHRNMSATILFLQKPIRRGSVAKGREVVGARNCRGARAQAYSVVTRIASSTPAWCRAHFSSSMIHIGLRRNGGWTAAFGCERFLKAEWCPNSSTNVTHFFVITVCRGSVPVPKDDSSSESFDESVCDTKWSNS